MKTNTKCGLVFALGVAAGGAGMWFCVKDFYKQRTDEEIRSVKEAFHAMNKEADDISETKLETPEHTTVSYSSIASEYQSAETKKPRSIPYIISPDAYGEEEDYRMIELIYYADGVLAEENDEVIEDPDDIVGPGALTHFGEYEDDSVYVRDDARKRDIQILLDPAKYTDIVKNKPGRVKLT